VKAILLSLVALAAMLLMRPFEIADLLIGERAIELVL
jgi:hypothetical protein